MYCTRRQALGLELCDNQTLQVLDVSHNRVTGPAAVVRTTLQLRHVRASKLTNV